MSIDRHDVPLSTDDVRELVDLLSTEQSWFAKKRLAALQSSGVTAAVKKKWNPLLHPRGHDGRFIRKLGWVRWLDNLTGAWMRGQVEYINPNNGALTVRDHKTGYGHHFPSAKDLYTIPTPKATLKLPSPNAVTHDDSGWKKTGGQAGSNLGAKFVLNKADAVSEGVDAKAFRSAASSAGLVESDDHEALDDGYLLSDGVIYRVVDKTATPLLDPLVPNAPKIHNPLNVSMKLPPGDSAAEYVAGQIMMQLAQSVPVPGSEFYVKQTKSGGRARNEVLANDLYQLAGVNVPDVHLGIDGLSVASKIVNAARSDDDEKPETRTLSQATPDELDQIRRDFVVDAWLANWDVAGLDNDNILIVDGQPVRIDAGGAIEYRAMGSPKGSAFTKNGVPELDSLRDPKVNPNSAKLFGPTSDEQMLDGAKRVAAIHPEEIQNLVEDAGAPQDVADTLIARRAHIIERFNIDDPHKNKPSVSADSSTSGANGAGDLDAPKAVLEDVDFDSADNPIDVAIEDMLDQIEEQDSDLDVDPTLDSENYGLSPSLLLATPPFKIEETGDEKQLDEHIGASVIVQFDSYSKNHSLLGKLIEAKTQPSSGEPYVRIDTAAGSKYYSANLYKNLKVAVLQDGSPGAIAAKEPPPVTIKKTGEIIIAGKVVGKRDLSNSWQKKGTLFGEFSTTGKDETITTQSVAGLRKAFQLRAVVDPPAAKEKSPAAKALKSEIKDKADPASATSTLAATLSSGEKAEIDQWVEHLKSGEVSQIVGWPSQEKYPNYVYVKGTDGKKKLRSVNTLALTKSPAAAAEAADNPYAELKTADGKTPAIGQKVQAGKANSQVEGTILSINPKNGYVKIQKSDGSKVTKTLATTHVLEDVDPDQSPGIAVGAAKAHADALNQKTPDLKSSVLYPSADGSVVQQPESIKSAWLSPNSSRALSADGYAPEAGLAVRDKSGKLFYIVDLPSSWAANQNSIRVYDPQTGKKFTRSIKTLHVDHAVNTDTKGIIDKPGVFSKVTREDGNVISIPNGATLYVRRVKLTTYNDGPSRVVDSDQFYYIAPGALAAVYMGQHGTNSTGLEAMFYESDMHQPAVKIGVFDSSGDKQIIYAPQGSKHIPGKGYTTQPGSVIFGDADKTTTDVVLIHAEEKIKAATAVASQSGPPTVLDASKLDAKLPDGPIPDEAAAPQASKLHVPTGKGADLKTVPDIVVRNNDPQSIFNVAAKTVAMKDDETPGSASLYALGDSTYVEDMLFRTQVVKNPDGSEALEIRLRLLEDRSEDLADRLLTADTTVEKGAWIPATSVYAADLKEGDAISVKVSSQGSVHKLKSSSSAPNATVVSSQKLPSEGDTDIYRVTFLTPAGDIGQIDLQQRSTASIPTYTWDPTFVKTHSGSSRQLSAEAMKNGWSHKNGQQYPGKLGHIMTDSTGKHVMTGESSVTIHDTGSHLQKTTEDGVVIVANVAHKEDSGTGHGAARRANSAGEVRLRVPIDGDGDGQINDETALAISKALEEIGIPVEAQEPPTPDALVKLGLSKLVTNFAENYKYRSPKSLSVGDPDVTSTLEHLSKTLGIDVTLKDVRVHTHETGRVQFMWSPEVAEAISKRQGNKFYSHSGTNDNIVIEMLGGAVTGLMSTDERWSAGIFTNGSSSSTDIKNGSGDRLYLSGYKTALGNKLEPPSSGVKLTADALNSSMEVYVNEGDGWGKRKIYNGHIITGGAHEYMVKRRIEPEQIAFVGVKDRARVIAELKKRGVTHIGGRPIEAIISNNYDSSNTAEPIDLSSEGRRIGVLTADDPSLQDLIDAMAEPGAAPAVSAGSVA